MARAISHYDDIIDSRDVIERIEQLSEDVDIAEGEVEELADLRGLADEGQYFDDWEYGVTLIRESYFVTYAQELAEDIGAVNSDAQWPNNHIDWEAAARDLLMDYSSVDFRGVTYYAR